MIRHYMMIFGVLSLISLAFPFSGKAQTKDKYERGIYIAKGDTMPYRILFPYNFDPSRKYPLILVLHGSGERGNDNEVQLSHGGDLFLKPEIREQYQAIVVFPQCPKEGSWSNVQIKTDSAGKRRFDFVEGGAPTQPMINLMGLLDQLLDKPYVNKHQVYVGGLSMGGMGTFEILRRKPNTFAAAFAICGGDNSFNAKKYAKKVPLWIFHGAQDDVVPAEHSEIMVEAIKAAGGDPKFTLYPNDKHNSWDDAFKEPDLIPWLFEHKK